MHQPLHLRLLLAELLRLDAEVALDAGVLLLERADLVGLLGREGPQLRDLVVLFGN